MGMDLQVREFSKAIADFVDGSELPAEVKRLALTEIAQKAAQESDRAVISQIAERDKEIGQKAAGIKQQERGAPAAAQAAQRGTGAASAADRAPEGEAAVAAADTAQKSVGEA